MLGADIGVALGGAIYTEVVFGLPGLSQTAWEALDRQDFAVLQGIVVVTSVCVILLNIAVDLLYQRLEPRLRL
jgi:ABC-type dipeptide/oligopeptide/nickel transport system permease component